MTTNKVKKVTNVTNRLFGEGIVKNKNLYDVVYDMTDASYNVLARSRTSYKDVWCQWDDNSPKGQFKIEPALFAMMKDCVQYLNGVNLILWTKLYKDYVASGYNSEILVSWDRINDDKTRNASSDYILSNMQPLAFKRNIIKGNSKPHIFVLYQGTTKLLSDSFETIEEIKEALNFLNDVNVHKLVEKALKLSKDKPWQLVEFTYAHKKYSVQAVAIDKLSRYYSAPKGTTLLMSVPDLT